MSSAVPHDQQSIEQAKRDCRRDEHIHRSDPIRRSTFNLMPEDQDPGCQRRSRPEQSSKKEQTVNGGVNRG